MENTYVTAVVGQKYVPFMFDSSEGSGQSLNQIDQVTVYVSACILVYLDGS
jgi:hypothetical protein